MGADPSKFNEIEGNIILMLLEVMKHWLPFETEELYGIETAEVICKKSINGWS